MNVIYDRKIPLAGIGVSPWPRLGLQDFFDDYKIASFYDWDIRGDGAPEVLALQKNSRQRPAKLNTGGLLKCSDFISMLNKVSPRDLITYKPLELNTEELRLQGGLKIIRPAVKAAYENKAWFRSRFHTELPFPEYEIIEPGEKIEFEDRGIVLQDEALSGGKGTYIIKSAEQLDNALTALKSPKRRIVASRYIEGGYERSLQCCATKYGTFVGSLQKQLIDRPELIDIQAGGSKFCGGEISPGDSLRALYGEMRHYAEVIGRSLYSDGYRGIFGVDFIISKEGRVYVLETNQRLTGLTPLHAIFYREGIDVPFLLLHVLEQGNFDYKIEDLNGFESPQREISLMLIHSQNNEDGLLIDSLKSGIYDSQASFKTRGYRYPRTTEDWLIQQYIPIGTSIKPNSRLAAVFKETAILDTEDNISDETKEIITSLRERIEID
jgi:hypothetical protein